MHKNKTIPITDSDSSLDLLKPKTLKEKFRSSLGYLTKPNAPSRKVSKESRDVHSNRSSNILLALPQSKTSRINSAHSSRTLESLNARPSVLERAPDYDLETIKEVNLQKLPEKSISEFLLSKSVFSDGRKQNSTYQSVYNIQDHPADTSHTFEKLDLENMGLDEVEEIDLCTIVRDGNDIVLEQLIHHSQDERPWIDFAKQLKILDDKSMSPLHYAARFNRVRCAQIILDFGKNNLEYSNLYKLPGKDDTLPIHIAAKYLPTEIRNNISPSLVSLESHNSSIVHNESEINSPTTSSPGGYKDRRWSKLSLGTKENEVKRLRPKNVLELFIKVSRAPNSNWSFPDGENIMTVSDSYGQSILHFAVQRDNLTAVKMIVDYFEIEGSKEKIARRASRSWRDSVFLTRNSKQESIARKSENTPLIQRNSADLADLGDTVKTRGVKCSNSFVFKFSTKNHLDLFSKVTLL